MFSPRVGMGHSPGQTGLKSEVRPPAFQAPSVEKEVRGADHTEHDQQLMLKILGDIHSKVAKKHLRDRFAMLTCHL